MNCLFFEGCNKYSYAHGICQAHIGKICSVEGCNKLVKAPLDWSLIVCDPGVVDPEVLPITSLNDRGFKTFVFNPITGFMPEFIEVEIVNIYQDVKWYFPKLKYGHILAVPLEEKNNPKCVYFVKETGKIPDVLSTEDLW